MYIVDAIKQVMFVTIGFMIGLSIGVIIGLVGLGSFFSTVPTWIIFLFSSMFGIGVISFIVLNKKEAQIEQIKHG